MKRLRHCNRGITLIEIMVAFVILTMGLFVMLAAFPQLFALETRTEEIFIATACAQEKLDELTDTGKPLSISETSDSPSSLRSCTRTWWGEEAGSGAAGLQKANVKVTWLEKGTLKSLTVTGLISLTNPGP